MDNLLAPEEGLNYLKKAEHSSEDESQVRSVVTGVLDDVRANGEDAVRKYSQKFDDWSPQSFRVTQEQVNRAARDAPASLLDDMKLAHIQIQDFAKRQLDQYRDFEEQVRPGVWLGQRVIPIKRIGSYTPGGRYPLIVSALMTITTARVAGVDQVLAVSPPTSSDGMNPATLCAISLAGADEIYCIGGIQALAALAYGGLEGVEPVDLLTGAGNVYVAEAKRQLFGTVGIDLLAGPTEILVLADESADADLVAADLLGQAEHDPRSAAVLVTTSEEFGERVLVKVEELLHSWPTKEIAGIAWANCGEIVIASGRDEAVAISDFYGAEHLEVQTGDPQWYAERLRNYGSLFIGEEATVVFSDKCIGTNHVLPTRRASRYTGGLSVGKFLKIQTTHRLDAEGSRDTAGPSARLSAAELMFGHEITALMREEKYSRQ